MHSGDSSSEICSETEWKEKSIHTGQRFNIPMDINPCPTGHNLLKRGQSEWAASSQQIRRSLGNCCTDSTASCKTCPERGDAAELVPLTLRGILDRFDSAAGLCHEEKQFSTEKGVPVRVLQIERQHFSALERFVYFHTHIHAYSQNVSSFHFHSVQVIKC